DGIGDQREVSRALRRRQRRAQCREVAAVSAAAFADAAQLTGPAPDRNVFRRWFSEVSTASDRYPSGRMAAFDLSLEVELGAVEIHRLEETAVGKLLKAFAVAGDAGERFDVVVPRRNIRISD